jgi:hypothetical protein
MAYNYKLHSLTLPFIYVIGMKTSGHHCIGLDEDKIALNITRIL